MGRVLKMRGGERLSRATRAKAAEAGLWETSAGEVVAIRKMNDGHLVNALLKELAAGDRHEAVVAALAGEVKRRRLEEFALAVAAERMEGRR